MAATRAGYLLSFYYYLVRRLLDDLVFLRAIVSLAEAEHDPSVPVAPCRSVDLVCAVVGTGREFAHGAVVTEFEIFLGPTRERKISAGIAVDRPALMVVAMDVHPARIHQRASCRVVYHRPRRGPFSVARMRATCCVVNMNIASSSV